MRDQIPPVSPQPPSIDLAQLTALLESQARISDDKLAALRAELRAASVPAPKTSSLTRAWQATQGWRTAGACVAVSVAPYVADALTQVDWDNVAPLAGPIIGAIFFGIRAYTSTPIFQGTPPPP